MTKFIVKDSVIITNRFTLEEVMEGSNSMNILTEGKTRQAPKLDNGKKPIKPPPSPTPKEKTLKEETGHELLKPANQYCKNCGEAMFVKEQSEKPCRGTFQND